jgi:hypothetical protein
MDAEASMGSAVLSIRDDRSIIVGEAGTERPPMLPCQSAA